MSPSNRRPADHQGADDTDGFYDDLQEQWPKERPSSRRARRVQRRQGRRKGGRVMVRAERREVPDVEHISRALLAAQRELARAQAEAAAEAQAGHAEDDEATS